MSFSGVAKTALLVAAMRAAETKRSENEGRLFTDLFAESLAGTLGLDLLEKAIAEVGEQPAIAIRTRFIDDQIKLALDEGIRQIVILAAGMDARAYRMNFPEGTCLFELDRPEVLNFKNDKIRNSNPLCIRYSLGVDLAENWQNKIIEIGMKPSDRTLWVVEGLIMYLDEKSVIELFKKINSLCTSNCIVLFDLLGRRLLDAPHMKKQLDFLANIGAPWLFGADDPEKFVSQFGWKVSKALQASEVAPTRWPFPTAPRNIPNVPRSYFVEART